MTQHTQGSWHYQPCFKTASTKPFDRYDLFSLSPPRYDNNYGINTGSKKTFIASIRAQANKNTAEANARLIAAAPELLAALQAIASGKVMKGEFTHAQTVLAYQELARNAVNKLKE